MTEGERNLVADLQEFVRQTSDLLEDEPQTSGIRPNPVIEVTETTLETTRFGGDFGPQPSAEVEPTEGGGGPPPTATGACCMGTGCSLLTQSDCEGAGGIYQGDDTTCDSPYTCLCCYSFISSITLEMHVSGTTTCDCGNLTVDCDFSHTWNAGSDFDPFNFCLSGIVLSIPFKHEEPIDCADCNGCAGMSDAGSSTGTLTLKHDLISAGGSFSYDCGDGSCVVSDSVTDSTDLFECPVGNVYSLSSSGDDLMFDFTVTIA